MAWYWWMLIMVVVGAITCVIGFFAAVAWMNPFRRL